jgi:phosphoglycolate phosphatase
MKDIKAVMFDLDGTLLDTLSDLANCMNQALASFGFPQHDETFYRKAVGDGIHLLAIRSLPETSQHEEQVTQLIQSMREIYDQNWMCQTKPYDGIEALLQALQSRGIQMAVLSNKPDEKTRQCVDHYFGLDAFQIVMGASEHFPLKPAPQAVKHIEHSLQIHTDHWLYVGDTNTDMLTAKNANMYAIGVTWGFRDADELRAHGADTIIDSPMELIDILKNKTLI